MKTKILFFSLALICAIGCKKNESSKDSAAVKKSSLTINDKKEDELLGEYTFKENTGKVFHLKIEKTEGKYNVSIKYVTADKWNIHPATELSPENIAQFASKEAQKNIDFALGTSSFLVAKLNGQTVIKNLNYTTILNSKYAIIGTTASNELTKIK